MMDMNMNEIKKGNLVMLDDGMYLGSDKILGFIPEVTAVKEIQTGDEVKAEYDIAIRIKGNIVDKVTVGNLMIRSWYGLSRYCPDAGVSDKTRKVIERFLQEQAAQLPALRMLDITKKGWCCIDGTHMYCHNDTVICGAIDEFSIKRAGCSIIRTEDFEPNIWNGKAFLEGIKETAKGTSWILCLVSFFDILKEPFRKAGHPIEFISNVYGCSGSGKTTLIKTLCSPAQIFSFRSQKRRDTLLREASGYEGHTVLFDDFHPAENKADSDRQKGIKDSLARMAEEKPDAPNIIISSEYLDGHRSLQDREIQIFLDGNLNWEMLSTLADKKKLIENIRIAFYVQIVKNVDAVVDDIKKFCNKADKKISKNKDFYRNARYFSYIECVDYLFHRYFVTAHGLDWQYEIKADIKMHMERQERHMGIVTRLERMRSYLPIVRDMLLDGAGLEQVADWREFVPDSRTYHIDREGQISISLKALQRGLMKFLQVGDLPMKKIIKEMIDANVIIPYENTKEYTQKHSNKRYYRIDTEELEEACSIFDGF